MEGEREVIFPHQTVEKPWQLDIGANGKALVLQGRAVACIIVGLLPKSKQDITAGVLIHVPGLGSSLL